MSYDATGRAEPLAADFACKARRLRAVKRGMVLLQQSWSFVQPLALSALELFGMGGAVQGHVRTVGVLSDEMSRAVRAHQRTAWSVLSPHVQRQLEPESESPVAHCAGERVAARVCCSVLTELQDTVGGKGTVGAVHVPHARHGIQLLACQFLLVHHSHVGLLLALIRELVAAQSARKLEVARVNQSLVIAHIIKGRKFLRAVRTLGGIGKVVGALVLGQTAPAGVTVTTLITQKRFGLCVASEMSPVAAERLQFTVADMTHIVAVRSGLHMNHLMLKLHVFLTLCLLEKWLLALFTPEYWYTRVV